MRAAVINYTILKTNAEKKKLITIVKNRLVQDARHGNFNGFSFEVENIQRSTYSAGDFLPNKT